MFRFRSNAALSTSQMYSGRLTSCTGAAATRVSSPTSTTSDSCDRTSRSTSGCAMSSTPRWSDSMVRAVWSTTTLRRTHCWSRGRQYSGRFGCQTLLAQLQPAHRPFLEAQRLERAGRWLWRERRRGAQHTGSGLPDRAGAAHRRTKCVHVAWLAGDGDISAFIRPDSGFGHRPAVGPLLTQGFTNILTTARHNGRLHSWNIAYQRTLPGAFTAEVAYVGNRAEDPSVYELVTARPPRGSVVGEVPSSIQTGSNVV